MNDININSVISATVDAANAMRNPDKGMYVVFAYDGDELVNISHDYPSFASACCRADYMEMKYGWKTIVKEERWWIIKRKNNTL